MRKPLMAGNWKMNKSVKEVSEFFNAFMNEIGSERSSIKDKVDVLFAVPYLQLVEAKKLADKFGIIIAAQNVHFEKSGAYTGEISIEMLKEIGVTTTLIGHSERRQYFGETDETVARKVKAAIEAKVTPIVCIGETKEERESNRTEAVLRVQVKAFLDVLEKPHDLVVAYEPVWAIGTGLTATNEQAEAAHAFIRRLVNDKFGPASDSVRILYGGSANPANIKSLMEQPNIDGGLVGGASLKPADFSIMVKAAINRH